MAAVASALGCSGTPIGPRQMETLTALIAKHLQDSTMAAFADGDDFRRTTMDRGLQRWEHAHLIAALDVLNAYQRDRRAQSASRVLGMRVGMRRQYKDDPRTRLVELLKRWLRANAANQDISEDDVRRISSLCRDLLNHPALFPARNPRSFLRTVTEVYEHLQWQLREVLGRDRTCAEHVRRAMSLSRNLLSDAISYLLLAPTDMRQTDALPSVEAVALWQSLPSGSGHPLPSRTDATLQKAMKGAWQTHCGALVAAILSAPWAVRLFDGRGAEEEAAAAAAAAAVQDTSPSSPSRRGKSSPTLRAATSVTTAAAQGEPLAVLLARAEDDFAKGQFKTSGLAGALRLPARQSARQAYLAAVEIVSDLTYLLGEALVQFHRISDGLGDYGLIRISPMLHPFLQALGDKVQRLRAKLEHLNEAVESALVLARARGLPVEKPAPSDLMCARAHAAYERAVSGRESHTQVLLQALEDLRARSAPERLPLVAENLGDAYSQLTAVLQSNEFRNRVGDDIFSRMPPLQSMTSERVASPKLLAVDDGALAIRDSSDLSEVAVELTYSPMMSSPEPAREAVEPEVAPSCCSQGFFRKRSNSTPAATSFVEMAPNKTDRSSGVQVLSGDCLRAQVYRLTGSSSGSGWRRHDRRALHVESGKLIIFEKGSFSVVKSSLEICRDVEECSMLPGGVMSIFLRRPPRGGRAEDGVSESKVYFFEFSSPDAAEAFHRAIRQHKDPRPWARTGEGVQPTVLAATPPKEMRMQPRLLR